MRKGVWGKGSEEGTVRTVWKGVRGRNCEECVERGERREKVGKF